LRDRRYAAASHRRSRRSLYRDRRPRRRAGLVVSPARDACPSHGAGGSRVTRPAIRGGVTPPIASIAVQGSATAATRGPRRIAGHATHAPPTAPEGRALRDRRYAAASHRRSRRSLYRDRRPRQRAGLVVPPGTRRVPLPRRRRVARCATGHTRRRHTADRVDRCTGIGDRGNARASSYRRARDACPSTGPGGSRVARPAIREGVASAGASIPGGLGPVERSPHSSMRRASSYRRARGACPAHVGCAGSDGDAPFSSPCGAPPHGRARPPRATKVAGRSRRARGGGSPRWVEIGAPPPHRRAAQQLWFPCSMAADRAASVRRV
jgi:hypothetical protein